MGSFDCQKIMCDVATSLIKDIAKSSWENVKKFLKDIDAKEAIRYGGAYYNYLQNVYEKNSKIKTLIYRRIPKDLYSFYVCMGVLYKNKIIETDRIENLLNISNKIIITGTGGIGKSILLKHLFLDTIVSGQNIPVLIELRKFNSLENKEISLYNAVYQNLCDNGFKLEDKYYSYSLEEGGYVILLDGFDEVNRDKAANISNEIIKFSGKYNKNKFIISSRPADLFIGWNDYHEMEVCALTKEQALSLIKKIEFDESVKDTFYEALDKELFEKYTSFASNPLLLTIMLLTFNNHASIPDKLNDFYEEAFSTLFNMHDATKDCYVRDIRSSLGCEDFKTVFSYICFKSYFKGDFEFSDISLRNYIQQAKDKFTGIFFTVDDFQEDLTLSVCMLVKDGLNYRFAHRSFQEYFAAWYTCKLTDDIQSKLLTGYLTESSSCMTDEYISMLYNLQADKVNKIVLCPGIKIIKSLYKEKGFTYDLIVNLFDGVVISKRSLVENGVKKDYLSMGVSIGNRYLCNIMMLVTKLNRCPSKKMINEEEQEILQKIMATDNGSKLRHRCSFDNVLAIISQEELLCCLKWVDSRLQFCFDIYDKYSENSALKKRKVASIIDEL